MERKWSELEIQERRRFKQRRRGTENARKEAESIISGEWRREEMPRTISATRCCSEMGTKC